MDITSVKTRSRSILAVFREPENILRAILYSAGVLFVLQWLFAFPQLVYIWQTAPAELPRYLIEGFFNFLRYVDGFIPWTILSVAVLQGIALTLLRVVRRQATTARRTRYPSLMLAVLGSGCVACGGSVIAPLFASYSAAVATQLSELVSRIVLAIAVILAMVTIYKISGYIKTGQPA